MGKKRKEEVRKSPPFKYVKMQTNILQRYQQNTKKIKYILLRLQFSTLIIEC